MRAFDLGDRQGIEFGEFTRLERQMGHPITRVGRQRPHNIHQISHHRRCRRLRTCPRAVMEGISNSVTVDQNSIHHTGDIRQQLVFMNQTGMHPKVQTAFFFSGDS